MPLNFPLVESDKNFGVSPTISCFGDSLTAGSGGTPITTYLSERYRRLVNNYGIGGQTAQQIACRQGAIPIFLTLSGNAFAGTAAVSVTARNFDFLSTGADNNARYFSGRIGNVQCMVTRTATGTFPSQVETYTIQPVGSTTQAIPAKSRFYPDQAFNSVKDIQILWLGRNNVPILTGLDGWIDSCVGMVSRPRRVLIVGVHSGQSETTGTGNRVPTDAMNAILLANYPDNYVSIAPPTQAEATAVGYGTFTSQDNTDIANGIFPATFYADSVHLNSFGYQVIANRLIDKINGFGW